MTTQEFLNICENHSCGNCELANVCVTWTEENHNLFYILTNTEYNRRKAEYITAYLRKKKLEKLLKS